MNDDSDSESDTENGSSISITKRSLDKAIALVCEEDETPSNRNEERAKKKILRECHLPSLRAHNLLSAADIFSTETSSRTVLEELRRSLLEDNYSAAARLLQYVLQSGSKTLLPIIWKTAVVLFLNKDHSTEEEFLEMCADQRLPEDKRRLIETLVTLPESLHSSQLKSGHGQIEIVDMDQSLTSSMTGDDSS